MLNRQIQIAADVFPAGHRLQNIGRDVRRMGVQQAQPAQTGNRRQIGQQAGKRRAVFQVAPVGGGVLADQNDFPDAPADQDFRFPQNIVRPAAARPAADGGDRAVGAAVGTAVRYFQISGGGAGGQQPFVPRRHQKIRLGDNRLPPGPACVEPSQMFGNASDFSRADPQVRFGNFRRERLAVALGQAAGHHQLQVTAALFFDLRQGQDRFQRFFFGRPDKAAGIDEDDIRVLRALRHRHSGGPGQPAHDFRINKILGAAQGEDVQFSGKQFFHCGSFRIRTFRGFAPSEGPTMPSRSICSIMRAARL